MKHHTDYYGNSYWTGYGITIHFYYPTMTKHYYHISCLIDGTWESYKFDNFTEASDLLWSIIV